MRYWCSMGYGLITISGKRTRLLNPGDIEIKDGIMYLIDSSTQFDQEKISFCRRSQDVSQES